MDAQEGFELMKKYFIPEVAKEFKKRLIIQYNIKGSGGGTWQVVINNGTLQILKDDKEKPVLKFNYDSVESFIGIQKGEIDGLQAYTMGKLVIEGPIPIAQKLSDIFKRE